MTLALWLPRRGPSRLVRVLLTRPLRGRVVLASLQPAVPTRHICQSSSRACTVMAGTSTGTTTQQNIPQATTTWHDIRQELVMRRPQQQCHVALRGAEFKPILPTSAKSFQIVARITGGLAFAATSDDLTRQDVTLLVGSLVDVIPYFGHEIARFTGGAVVWQSF